MNECYVREVAVAERSIVDRKKMVIDMIGSVEVRDRYGTRISIAGGHGDGGKGIQLDNYRANPVILWSHGRTTSGMGGGGGSVPGNMPIGKSLSVKRRVSSEPRALEHRIQFTDINPVGEMAFRMFEAGMLNASSVGVMPLKALAPKSEEEAKEMDVSWPYGLIFTESDLLELSIVGVPGNQQALKKTMGDALAIRQFGADDLRLLDQVGFQDEFNAALRGVYAELNEINLVSVPVEEEDPFDEFESDWEAGREWATEQKELKEYDGLATSLDQIATALTPNQDANRASASTVESNCAELVNRIMDIFKETENAAS